VATDGVAFLVALAAPDLELGVADLVQVAEDVRPELAVEIVPVRRVADLDAGEVGARLRDEREAVARDVLEDEEPVQAGARALCGGELEEPAHPPPGLGGEELGGDVDVERGRVVDEDVAVAVEELAAHRRDHLLGAEVVRRLLEVTLAAHDLELPQPPDEEDE